MTQGIAESPPATAGFNRAAFRRFVDDVVVPKAPEWDRREFIPREILDQVGLAGYWGARLPVSVGGAGADMVTLGELHEEVGRGCSSLRSLLTVHAMVSTALHRWGSTAARLRWLPALAAGEALAAFCLTEPEVGSDAAAISCSARRNAGGYVIDGTKRWITGGQIADCLLVFARTEQGPTAFLIDAKQPGVQRIPIHGALGTRASMLAEIRLENCQVGEDAVLGRAGAGMLVAISALELGRFSVATGSVGIMQAALEASVDYTSHRSQGGRLLKDHQLIQRLISDMVTRASAGRALCRRAAELKDRSAPEAVTATWIAKYFASTAAMAVTADAVQLHGANGCSDAYQVARHFRDAKIMEIIEGSNEIQQLTIAGDAYRQCAGSGTSARSVLEDKS